jgi:hypothetical protein
MRTDSIARLLNLWKCATKTNRAVCAVMLTAVISTSPILADDNSQNGNQGNGHNNIHTRSSM